MTRKLTPLLTALMLALSGAACSSDDRPEGKDVERTVDGAAEDAGKAAQDAGNAAEDATDGE